MIFLIILIGIFIIAAGIMLAVKPNMVLEFLESNLQHAWVHIVGVVVRIVLGLLLISQSSLSKFPSIIEIFGWLSLTAAVFLLIIDRKNFKRLVNWILSLIKPYARISGLLSAAFGVFLVYAFI